MVDLVFVGVCFVVVMLGLWIVYVVKCCSSMGGVSGPRRLSHAHPLTTEDAEFIAHSRADVESLVAEVERLRSRLSVAGAKPMKFTAAPGDLEDDGA